MLYNLAPVTDRMSSYIALYKSLIQGKTEKTYNELYKWRAAKRFRENWNPDAENLSLMLETCFTPSTNLTVGQNYYPVQMLRTFSEMDNEKVRNILKYLIDESIDVRERILNTEKELDELLKRYNSGREKKANLHYVGDRFLSVMLYFIYPDKYYLYKFSIFKDLSNIFSLPVPKRGSDDNFVNFCTLCDAIKEELIKDDELVKISKSILDESCYTDDSLHLLTQDFAYSCTFYLSEDDDTQILPRGDDSFLSEPPHPYGKSDGIHYWLLAPGAGAQMWEQFYRNGIAAIGWSEMGDLSAYPTREAMAEMLTKKFPNKGSQRHNSLALWNFSRDMKEGDIIVAKKGNNRLPRLWNSSRRIRISAL